MESTNKQKSTAPRTVQAKKLLGLIRPRRATGRETNGMAIVGCFQ